ISLASPRPIWVSASSNVLAAASFFDCGQRGLGQQLVAPIDCRAQCLLPRQRSGTTARQNPKSVVEKGGQLGDANCIARAVASSSARGTPPTPPAPPVDGRTWAADRKFSSPRSVGLVFPVPGLCLGRSVVRLLRAAEFAGKFIEHSVAVALASSFAPERA